MRGTGKDHLCRKQFVWYVLFEATQRLRLHSKQSKCSALMLLHDARRDGRVDEAGDIVVLEEQDRSIWNREQIRKDCC